MLTQLFLAAREEGRAPFPYVRHMIRSGLTSAAERLEAVSPELATQFLDVAFDQANLSDRFLLSAWGTLSARLRPLLTETVIRSLAGSDFEASEPCAQSGEAGRLIRRKVGSRSDRKRALDRTKAAKSRGCPPTVERVSAGAGFVKRWGARPGSPWAGPASLAASLPIRLAARGSWVGPVGPPGRAGGGDGGHGSTFFRNLRRLSPWSSILWALWTRRSRMASARVGSPTTSNRPLDGKFGWSPGWSRARSAPRRSPGCRAAGWRSWVLVPSRRG